VLSAQNEEHGVRNIVLVHGAWADGSGWKVAYEILVRAVITEAGMNLSVAGLVYVAAHMPDSGERESDDGKRFPSDLAKSGVIKSLTHLSNTGPASILMRNKVYGF
jgi:hypothetical protein